MDFTGRLKDVVIDYVNQKAVISFQINENPVGIEDIQDIPLKISATKFSKSRSLDSNAYFHVLCDKLRQKLGISMSAMKNHLITWYGQIEYIDDQPLIYKTNANPEYINEQESVHMKLLKIGPDGAYWYRVYRGSHTYNTEEMARLIQGTVDECNEQGIQTATPDELAHMNMLWGNKYERNKSVK